MTSILPNHSHPTNMNGNIRWILCDFSLPFLTSHDGMESIYHASHSIPCIIHSWLHSHIQFPDQLVLSLSLLDHVPKSHFWKLLSQLNLPPCSSLELSIDTWALFHRSDITTKMSFLSKIDGHFFVGDKIELGSLSQWQILSYRCFWSEYIQHRSTQHRNARSAITQSIVDALRTQHRREISLEFTGTLSFGSDRIVAF